MTRNQLKTDVRFGQLLALLCLFKVSGCCRFVVCDQPPTSVSMPASADCEPVFESTSCLPYASMAERMAEVKGRVGWQASELWGGVKANSLQVRDRFSHCGSCLAAPVRESKLAQWAEQKRIADNAPPFPRFHPIPTGPVFYPESPIGGGYNAPSEVEPQEEHLHR